MAPNFLSKLVKQPRSRNSSPTPDARSRVLSAPSKPESHPAFEFTPPPKAAGLSPNGSRHSSPSVTVIPPSPQSIAGSFPSREGSVNESSDGQEQSRGRRPPALSLSHPTPSDNGMPTPTPASLNKPGAERSLTPSSSMGNLRDRVRKLSLSRSPSRSRPAPAAESNHPPVSANPPTIRQSLEEASQRAHAASAIGIIMPVVDSPTAMPPAEYQASPTASSPGPLTPTQARSGTLIASAPDASLLSPERHRDTDTMSIASTASGRKHRLWRRGPTTAPEKDKLSPKRKPTGLASAIAASGLAMANPTRVMPPIAPDAPSRRSTGNTSSPPGSPPHRAVGRNGSMSSNTRSFTGRNRHSHHTSVDSNALQMSPEAMHSRNNSLNIPRYDGNGSESNYETSSGDDDDDDDELLAELNEDDIPVTGFAVASNKRNADFHELFTTIPEGDYLIEDYGCALQREILIQGRIYISENHICFHANIFGWITDLVIPIYDILSLDKKMTAFVIPNAIQITTRNTKYTFASFLARDTVYDVIYNIWRLARPEDGLTEDDTRSGVADASPESSLAAPANVVVVPGGPAIPARKATVCACGREGRHYSETAMEAIFPGTPEKIYNLMFASGFIKDFMRVEQKLDDIQISDWAPSAETKFLARNMSYIKPLGGSIGPRQTKCELRDETIYSDLDDYIVTITTTRTPDVPSGSVFSVKTRTCIMWASAISSKVQVTTQVEWTGRSFIKGIIEKSAIEGQKTYHNDLDKAMRVYIQQHQTEFIPAGVDLAVVAAVEPAPAPFAPTVSPKPELVSELEARKSREKERNQRGLQWAYDTFEGALNVATNSTVGALELVSDAWDQSTSSTILYFVIAFLVISNLWTLMLVGRREETGRRKEMRKTDEREKWVQGIVTALWDELAAGRPVGPPPIVQLPGATRPTSDWQAEVAEISRALDTVEERVRGLRQSLKGLD